jgi:hypothetical protein
MCSCSRFLVVQWPVRYVLVTNPAGARLVFNADNFVYWMSPTYEAMT